MMARTKGSHKALLQSKAQSHLKSTLTSQYQPYYDSYTHSDDDNYTSHDSDGEQEQRNVRGPTLMLNIWNRPENNQIHVKFNKRGQPIGEEASKLANFLGTMARNSELIPLNYSDWRQFPREEKKKILELARAKFVIPSSGERWFFRSLGKKCRERKVELRTEFVEKYRNVDELLANRPEHISKAQWISLVTHWFSDKGKRRSEINRKSQANQKMVHTTGSKSFAHLAAEMSKDGIEPTRAEIFLVTHKDRKDGKPMDDLSAKAVELMKERMEQVPCYNDQTIENVAWEGDIYSQVMGPDKNGYIRGLGLGPTRTTMWGSSSHLGSTSQDTEASHEIHDLKKVIKEMECRHAVEMKGMQAWFEAELAMLKSVISGRYSDQVMMYSSVAPSNGQMRSSNEPGFGRGNGGCFGAGVGSSMQWTAYKSCDS